MKPAVFFLAVSVFGAELPYEPKCDLLIQGAVDSELQPLLSALEDRKKYNIAAWSYWTGRIGKKSVVVSRTEVGSINAVAATVLGIRHFRPAAIINQGTAGAHNPALRLWDIVVGEKTIDYGAYKSDRAALGAGIKQSRWAPLKHKLRLDNRTITSVDHFLGDQRLMSAALAVPYTWGKVVKGNIGTAHQFNRELDRIVWIRQTYNTDSEDMESAFAAGVALTMKVPFVAIRIISDSEWNHPTFEKIAGQYCAQFVLDLVRRLR